MFSALCKQQARIHRLFQANYLVRLMWKPKGHPQKQKIQSWLSLPHYKALPETSFHQPFAYYKTFDLVPYLKSFKPYNCAIPFWYKWISTVAFLITFKSICRVWLSYRGCYSQNSDSDSRKKVLTCRGGDMCKAQHLCSLWIELEPCLCNPSVAVAFPSHPAAKRRPEMNIINIHQLRGFFAC